jgi:hypothetical protein
VSVRREVVAPYGDSVTCLSYFCTYLEIIEKESSGMLPRFQERLGFRR